MQKITPMLWFDDQAEEAANYYVSVFDGRPGASGDGERNKILEVSRYPEGVPGREAGMAMTVAFRLAGQEFTALNGGPDFTFNEATSFVVSCENQEEVDYFWNRFTDGGEESYCGWLKDRYGFSWQITPTALSRLMTDPDPERARRATEAMLKMRKIDIAEMERAADAVPASAGA